MDKRLYSGAGLLIVAALFLVFTAFNNTVLSGLKLDLTENNLYTLSKGTREIIDTIDEPINLYFFFSDKPSEDYTALRSYAQRVRELLERYEALADGRINLHFIDPEPFSEDEDRASAFGLTAIPADSGNDLYFGLAGTSALDDQEIIPFFQPDKEEFLEYEISRLVQSLANPERPVVGMMSSLEVRGGVNRQTFQPTPAWVVVEQLGELFDIRNVDAGATEIPPDIEVLMVIHPKSLSRDTLIAIDQFVMRGGRLLAFVDPFSEMDRPEQANPMQPQLPQEPSSDLNGLLSAWGVTMREGKIVGDSQVALEVSGPGGRPVRHLAILGLLEDNLASEDVVTASLANINMSSAGILDIAEDASTQIDPIIRSSEHAGPLDAAMVRATRNPEDLQSSFSPTGERYVLAARISGEAPSAFAEQADERDLVDRADNINVVVVADTDILSDRLWVQVQNFLGQRIASPWANNGDFVSNAVDNLVGSASLISVRGRGKFTRPFNVVQDLRREAESRYLESAKDLQAQLSETERKLSELQSRREESNVLSLSPEQEAAIEQFQQEKVRIRKQLRDVRHQLDRDIEALGTTLKFVNIFLMPLLLTLGLLLVNHIRTKRRSEWL